MNLSPRSLIIILATAGVLGIGYLGYWSFQREEISLVNVASVTNSVNENTNAPSQKWLCNENGGKWCDERDKCIMYENEPCHLLDPKLFLSDTKALGRAKGDMLYIKEGDVWRISLQGKESAKLVDRDTVTEARYSSDTKYLAYSQYYPSQETVTNSDGSKETVTLDSKYSAQYTLYLANEVGANSIRVKQGVGRWGWIPNTQLLWYETSSLKQIFEWGYYGNNDLWVYDVSSQKAKKVFTDSLKQNTGSLLGLQWSPDGSRALFAGSTFFADGSFRVNALKIVDRESREVKTLLLIPWVGGDRGGPAPIPTFFWGADSKTIYTGFTPLISASYRNEKINFLSSLQSNKISVLVIPISGKQPTELVPKASSVIVNNESALQVNFSNDRSKVMYYTVDSNEFDNRNDGSMYGPYGENKVNLIVRDIPKKTVHTIRNDITDHTTKYRVLDRSQASYITADGVYYFVTRDAEDSRFLVVEYYDFAKQQTSDVVKIPIRSMYGEDGLSDVLFLPNTETIFFRIGADLYKAVGQEVGLFIEKADNVEYYPL